MMPFPQIFPFFQPRAAHRTVATVAMMVGSMGMYPGAYPMTVVATDEELPWWNIVLEPEE